MRHFSRHVPRRVVPAVLAASFVVAVSLLLSYLLFYSLAAAGGAASSDLDAAATSDNIGHVHTAESYLRPEVVRQVQRLDLKARFIIEGFLSGLHASPYHGFSVEFSEHRKYVPGDDPALIDYHAWARTDKYYVRRYQAETNLSCYLLVDTSASMSYASGSGMTKLEYATCLSAALGYLMLRQQDAVGLVTFDDRIRAFVPPRATRGQLNNLLALLAQPTAGAATALAPAIHNIARRIRKRSLFILFSDLLDDAEAALEALSHLAFGKHDIIVFQVLDPAESRFDLDGPLELTDPETGDRISADADAVRADYLARMAALQQQYRSKLEMLHSDFVTVETSTPFDRALISYLLNRRKRF